MPTIDTVVIGAGHAGLATSRLLTAAGRDHVVIDRGRVAERWHSERWDSLRLLTPNWMTRLPGWSYTGAEQEGFMTAAAFAGRLERYAASFRAPLQTGTRVERVSARDRGFDVTTDRGAWRSRHVVVATGPWGRPHVPAALEPSGDFLVTTSASYRSPDRLPPGGVLVVGASSSGIQIADELARAGREVWLSVGRHTRVPRRYRGMDIFWWLDQTGRLARTIDDYADPAAARREPSLQLVGREGDDAADVDLASVQRRGVSLLGRLDSVTGRHATFRDDLPGNVVDADSRLCHLLESIDAHVARTGLEREVTAPSRPAPVPVPEPRSALDLTRTGITTVLLATGYRPDHGWLDVPVLDDQGAVRQRRGVTPVPGLYVVGQRFQHRRDSGFIDGARHDAGFVVGHLAHGTGRQAVAAAADAGSDR